MYVFVFKNITIVVEAIKFLDAIFIRQNEPFCLLLKIAILDFRGLQPSKNPRTLDKTNAQQHRVTKTANQAPATGKTIRATLGYAQNRWISLLFMCPETRQIVA